MRRALMVALAVCALAACDAGGDSDGGTSDGAALDAAARDVRADAAADAGDPPSDAAGDVAGDVAVMDAATDAAPDAVADARPDVEPDAAALDRGPEPDSGAGPVCPGPFAALAPDRDVRYGPAERQIFDLYLPDAQGPFPVFVWIHGGGWRNGSHSNVPRPIAGLTDRGLAVMSITYRLSDHPFPTPISDVRTAIRWLHVEGPDRGLDPSRIAVGGSSAGGHLAAILGTGADVAALDLEPAEPAEPAPRVHLVVDFFGPSDLLAMDDDAVANGCGARALCHDCVGSPEALLIDCEAELSTCPEPAILASPVTHVDPSDPPFVVLHGARDCTVPTPQGRRMHEALVAAGVESTLHITPGAGHNVGEVSTDAALALMYDALDRHILDCERAAPAPPADAGVAPPDAGPVAPLDECLVEQCPEESAPCSADPACLRLDTCIRACLGMDGCIADCTAGVARASIATHRSLFDCGRPAGCYR